MINRAIFAIDSMEQSITQLIQAVETADSSDGLLEAVKALAAARHQAAIPILIDVLRYNNPGASVAAVDGLIDLGDVAVDPLLENLDGYNYGARAWATRALAGIGDPQGLDLLLEAAISDFSLSVRRAAAKGLGSMRWSKLPETQVIGVQTQVLTALLLVSEDPEWVVRYAAVVGLQSLALAVREEQPHFLGQILDRLQQLANSNHEELAVRARVQFALQELRKKGELELPKNPLP